MTALNRFRRDGIGNLRVGDEIRFAVLFQSRTGYIVRVRARGRIEALTRAPSVEGEPALITGLLKDRHGIVQPFTLTERDRVFRKSRVLGSARGRDETPFVEPDRDVRDVSAPEDSALS